MNAKYCKLIRKVVRDEGYPPLVAKRLKADLIRQGITTPTYEFLQQVMRIVEKKLVDKIG